MKRSAKVMAAIGALVAAFVVAVGPGSAASASPQDVNVLADGRVEIKNQATGLCLDSNYESQAYTMNCNDGAYQRWYIKWDPNTYIRAHLVNQRTGMCLDGNNNGALYMSTCDSTWRNHYQLWHGLDLGTKGVYVPNDQTGRCLDSNGQGKAYTNPCNRVDNINQRWNIVAKYP